VFTARGEVATAPEFISPARQRSQVADWTEVRQLVGVDGSADARDLAGGDIQHHHGDQPLLRVEVERFRRRLRAAHSRGRRPHWS